MPVSVTRCFVLFLALGILSPPLGLAEASPPAFSPRVSPDRASLGFSSLLEIRDDGQRVLRLVAVYPSGPAASAGLLEGDLIVGMNGRPLTAWRNDLEWVLDRERSIKPGDTVTLDVQRGRKTETVRVEAVKMAQAQQEKLIAWISVARERLAGGLPLYCSDSDREIAREHLEELERTRRLEELFAAMLPLERAQLTITRQHDGGYSIETEPHFDLPSSFLLEDIEPIYELVAALRPGEIHRTTIVNPRASR